jgi:hypothetical protein
MAALVPRAQLVPVVDPDDLHPDKAVVSSSKGPTGGLLVPTHLCSVVRRVDAAWFRVWRTLRRVPGGVDVFPRLQALQNMSRWCTVPHNRSM